MINWDPTPNEFFSECEKFKQYRLHHGTPKHEDPAIFLAAIYENENLFSALLQCAPELANDTSFA